MQFDIAQVNRLGNRQSNQDRFTVIERDEGLLAVLADGMGGRARGDIAAQMLIESAKTLSQHHQKPVKDVPQFLDMIVKRAHQMIAQYSEELQLGFLPGTTGVLGYFREHEVTIGHVGDSRFYHYRGNEMKFHTVDHSFIQAQVSKGVMTLDEAKLHPNKNQITRCIGCRITPPVTEISGPISLIKSDTVLLCSDGLWGSLSDQQIGNLLQRQEVSKIAEQLAEEAERRSYPQSDNISVIVLRYRGVENQDNDDEAEQDKGKGSSIDAIDHIQQMIKEYEEEMNGN